MRRRSRPLPVRTRPAVIEPVEPRLLWAAHVAGSGAAYSTIQAAVNAAPTGGTVTVDAGTYAEQVTVSKKLTILGAQAGVDARSGNRPNASAATESVVTGAASGGVNSCAFDVLANDVTIDGFTVTGETNQDDTLGAGIVIGPKQSGTHVVNDVVRGNVSGLFLANYSSTDAALIQHCYFGSNNNAGENGGRGIYTDNGISGGNLTNVTIDANTFYNNHGSSGTTGFEAAMAFEAWTAGEQSNIRITNNAITNNGKAVLFFNTTNVLIQGNTVTGTTDQWSGSLRFEGNDQTVSILYNTIDANRGPGVSADSKGVPGDDSGFTINDNNIVGNNTSYAPRLGVAVNFDCYDGALDVRNNYWGSTTGPGGAGPGTGDAVSNGAYNAGPNGSWSMTGGGNILWSPFATAVITAPTGTTPAAPSALVATATGQATVTLAWTDNAAGNETGFTVQRSNNGGSTYATVATTATGVTTYADAGLTAGTTYLYRVYAINGVGTSGASNTATATTAVPVAPSAPSSLKATATSSSAVSLAWTPGTGQTAYAIDRSTNGGATFTTITTSVAASATTYADSGLSAATTYTYRVRATNAAGSAASSTATATTAAAGVTTVSLTSLAWTSATVGWGTLQVDASIKGNPITLRGTTYPLGLGAHASSTITYALAGRYAAFTCAVGVDDEVNGQGAVDFQVLGDGNVLYNSGVVTGSSPVGYVTVPVANVQTLTLLATPGVAGSIDYDHADWANPLLTTAVASQATATALAGAVIGTAGSSGSSGNTIARAVDGNLSTYFDGPTASGDWVGLDLGSARTVTQVAFAPRSGYASRMVGGVFQASTSADFSTGVTTLYTVTVAPPAGVLTTAAVTSPVSARYVRYLGPANSNGDVADVVFYG